MAIISGLGEPFRLDVGDRVKLTGGLGGLWHSQLKSGSTGVVIAHSAGGKLKVRFDNAQVKIVLPERLTLI
jgi:hypothetical protein